MHVVLDRLDGGGNAHRAFVRGILVRQVRQHVVQPGDHLGRRLRDLTGLADLGVAALGRQPRLEIGGARLVAVALLGDPRDLLLEALEGARLLAGGGLDGSIMQATLLDGVSADMRLYREESFGPVAVVLRGDGDEELLALANDSEFGLSAAIFSRDVSRALQLAQRIESGICHINGPTVHDEAQMPFGGVKASGYGSFGGQAAVEAFTQLRWVTVQNAPRHYPI